MCISIVVLHMIIFSFELVVSNGPDGDLMYRISQTQLNELAPILYENPREYFVHGFVDVCANEIQTIITSPQMVEPEKDISVILADRNSVNVAITYKKDLRIRAMLSLSRRSDMATINRSNRSFECQIKNAVFSVNANVGAYKALRYRREKLSGTVTGSDFLKDFLSETCIRQLLSKIVFELIRHKIDSIFQITYEYPDIQTDFRFLTGLEIHTSMYTIAQQVEFPEFWDIKSFVFWQNNTIPRLPPSIPFPVNLPQVDDAKRFEIWLSEKGIHKMFGDLGQSFINYVGRKVHEFLVEHVQEKQSTTIMAEDIFFLPKIAKVLPKSVIDVIPTKLTLWTTINNKSVSIFLNLSLDITATMSSKEKNTTLNIFSIDMNLQFPVQLGVTNIKLNANLMNLGGTVTIRNSTIGVIMNDALSSLLLNLLHQNGEKWMQNSLGDQSVSGIFLYSAVRDEFDFQNLSIRLEEGYAVLEADVVPSQSHNETEGEYTWVGYYDRKDWKIRLYDTNDTGMPFPHSTSSPIRHSSGGEVGRDFSLHCILLVILNGVLVLN